MPRGAKSRRPRGNSKHCHDGICGTFQFSAHPAIVSMSGEKVKPQSPFKTLANILQEFLFPALRVSHMFGGGPSEQEPFQTLLRFMESAQKSFQTQIRNPNPARPFYFSATSHYFPPFPFPNFFKRQWRAGKNVLRGECSGAGTENGKYWKEFCKSIDIFRKICFLGNHRN